jgi:hypothetical protein
VNQVELVVFEPAGNGLRLLRISPGILAVIGDVDALPEAGAGQGGFKTPLARVRDTDGGIRR